MSSAPTPVWQDALGADWETVHDRYLHTLGNLTLTGHNPEYSDRPFREKRDMEGGFRDSPVTVDFRWRLNRNSDWQFWPFRMWEPLTDVCC
ncbi:GmrSD restriction endonuclease domain-containing protein [Arthrobacter sp. TMN-49]